MYLFLGDIIDRPSCFSSICHRTQTDCETFAACAQTFCVSAHDPGGGCRDDRFKAEEIGLGMCRPTPG